MIATKENDHRKWKNLDQNIKDNNEVLKKIPNLYEVLENGKITSSLPIVATATRTTSNPSLVA